eukprot:CAMPEP_0119387104 /NCGR_PEP_ID=MMETSP1334-20130426/99210_1 /TAXON_ID=127549 /ORGANISM="Calcidiscus leptoporus, Strain RCC1130" /LENGTH=53 /DNA_ID=CAMNT_0007408755 /DNA_START=133 /DNA_END=294 /DNA_ORIENTATION=+
MSKRKLRKKFGNHHAFLARQSPEVVLPIGREQLVDECAIGFIPTSNHEGENHA